jgi:protein-tyrosine-phosphatase/DNA-binding HxlR family transcriptional regulator
MSLTSTKGQLVVLSESEIITVFKALSDPNRLRLFELLLQGDQTSSELMEQTGLRQNLLSHHLSILYLSGLIRSHQSLGDARRHYCSVNWHTARELGEWWQRLYPPDLPAFPALKQPRVVLFLCLRNASRSMMGEVIARHFASHALIPYSAGIEQETATLPAVTLRTLAEHGVPVTGFTAKSYTELPDIMFDYLITVCDVAHENVVPAALRYGQCIHWSLRDPVEGIDHEATQLEMARDLYDEIVLRLSFFVRRRADEER